MKKYNKPETKWRRSEFGPFALELHSSVGEGQLSNETLFDKEGEAPVF
jgi:hypothetical protein